MQKIEGKLYSPFQKNHRKVSVNRKDDKGWDFSFEDELVWEKFDATVNRVRASEGFKVSSFRDLIDIGNGNFINLSNQPKQNQPLHTILISMKPRRNTVFSVKEKAWHNLG